MQNLNIDLFSTVDAIPIYLFLEHWCEHKAFQNTICLVYFESMPFGQSSIVIRTVFNTFLFFYYIFQKGWMFLLATLVRNVYDSFFR